MRAAFCLLLLSTSLLSGADTKTRPKAVEITAGKGSPLGTFRTEFHVLPPNEVQQLWLVSSKNPRKRQLLYIYDRSVEVIFSDDEKWLAINDYAGSDLAEVVLFRRQKGMDYKQKENITDRAWQFVALKSGRKKRPSLDHDYVQVLRWTDDHTILLCLHGYGYTDERNIIDDWLCLYDVAARTFSTDLARHNQRHTRLPVE